eukprot:scaffold62552_cov19-Prasinocladus_malaysianus.AAC.1
MTGDDIDWNEITNKNATQQNGIELELRQPDLCCPVWRQGASRQQPCEFGIDFGALTKPYFVNLPSRATSTTGFQSVITASR